MGSYTPPPQGRSKLFGIVLYGRSVSSPYIFIYSIIYLYHYGLKHIYTILWVIIQNYFVAQIVQLWPLGALSLWLLRSFSFSAWIDITHINKSSLGSLISFKSVKGYWDPGSFRNSALPDPHLTLTPGVGVVLLQEEAADRAEAKQATLPAPMGTSTSQCHPLPLKVFEAHAAMPF